MRKCYSTIFRRAILPFLALFLVSQLKAQTTTLTTDVPTGVVYVSDDEPGVLIFGVRNTNTTPIIITDLASYNEPGGGGVYSLWYHPTAVTGAPSAITPANGWIKLCATGTVNPTSNAVIPTISGINLIIPPNTTYRLALEGPVHGPYYGTSGSTGTAFSAGGVTIFAQGNTASPTYAAIFPTLSTTFTPRSFYGSITFSVVGACSTPPVAGTAVASPASGCRNSPISLCLTGNTAGDGITYQWQSSPDNTNWTDISAASVNAAYMTTQTTSTYYRCAVRCGAGAPEYSTSVLVTTPPPVSGTFTINSAAATGGTNFKTFKEAIDFLNCGGISGPVVFNVLAGSGPYNERITIPSIAGASATNTITFNCNDVILESTPNTADRHLVRLDGADYVRINRLKIQAITGATFGWGVHLTNGADHNIIDSCTIDISTVTSTTQSNSGGIVVSGTTTSVTTDGSASYNTFSNNTIIGGYQGIIINGMTGALNAVQNVISGNTISDFYATGIELTDNDGAIVSNNNISRATRVTVTTFAGVELGAGNINCVIDGNRIHDTHNAATTQSGTAYGVYSTANDAPAGSENKVINNLIYNFNSTTGTIYALYNSGSDGVWYYHNTVVLDHPGSTSGVTRGFYQTTAASNIVLKNNIIHIARGGTGIKYCLYFGTTTSGITSDNNILYNTAPAGTNGIGSFGTAGSATLAAWQTANSGAYDQQSLSLNPQYVSAATGDYTPSNPAANNTGVGVGVTTDILGNLRSTTTPDAGAYEFNILVPGNNVSAEGLIAPATSSTGCYGAAETVTVSLRNNGTNAIDFTTNPVTVTVNVTGAITQMLSTTVNTGSLASGAVMNVPMPSTLNMSAAGVYTFNATTSMTGDTNPADDAMPPTNREKILLSVGTISASPDQLCISQSTLPVLSTDGTESGYSSVQWQQSTTPGTGFADIPGATTVPFTLASSLTQTMYYRLVVGCAGTTQTSGEATVEVTNPQILTTTPGTRCGTGSVTLSATSAPGSTVNWFDTPTGGTAIATGDIFVTPSLSGTTTYYVAATVGGAGVQSAGLANAISTSNYTLEAGLFFDAHTDFTIQGVYVYPTGTGAGTAVIALQSSTGATLQSETVNLTGTAAPYVKTYVPLNFNVPAGTNYRLVMLSRAGLVTGLIRESGTTWGTYPIVTPGILTITNGKCCPDATSTSYYYFYDWQVSAGCESARTPVIATVNPAPVLSITPDVAACNNAITTLAVQSNVADFNSYEWSPTAGLFTDAAATIPYTGGTATTVYAKTATADVHKYYLTANNSTTLCAALDSVSVSVLPVTITIDAQRTEMCEGDSVLLSLPEGQYGSGLQWYSSADGTTYAPIAGATSATYQTSPLTDTTYFKVEIKNGAGVVCLQPTIKIDVNNPQVLTTTPASRCSPGTVVLGATGNGNLLNWYAAPSGGSVIGTGETFTTPSINATTTYYVSASSGSGTTHTGMPAPMTGFISGAGTTNYGLVFDVLSPVTLKSVTIYPVGTAGGTGNVTIDVVDASNTVLHTKTVSVSTNPAASAVAHVVQLDFNLAPGTNLKMRPGFSSPVSGLLFGPTAAEPPGGYGYPYVVPGVLTIHYSTLTAPPTNTARPDLYYYFYDWVLGTGCESPRVAVTATVNTPEFTVAQDTMVCNNSITALSVTSDVSAFNSYVWSPSTGLYTDAAATIPYAGGSATTVYVKTATAGSTKYFINATNTVSGCGAVDSVTVNVMPGSLTINSSQPALCVSGTTVLSVPAGSYGSHIQWYSSTDGTNYTPIAGATSTTYTTPTLTATTYYKFEVKDNAGAVCLQPTITVPVNTPQVLAVTPGSRCGIGTVTLGAAIAPATATVNWYTTPSGGTPVGTGNAFVTPSLTNTTTYYVASSIAGSGTASAGLANAISTSNYTLEAGLFFDALSDFTLQGVYVYPTGTGAGTVDIALQSSTGANLQTITVNLTGTAAPYVKTFVPLNFNVPTGTNYRLVMLSRAGLVTGLIRESGSTWGTYPITTPGVVTITNGKCCPDATSTSYYYFYDWQVTSGCESPRTAVIATVTPAPPFSVARDTVVCNNAIVPLTVDSDVADFTSYEWTPVTGLYTDAAATIPYAGGSASTLYAKVSAAGIQKYYISANNATTLCTGLDSVKLTVLPATLEIDATKKQICGTGSTTLSLPAGEYGNATFQWYTSDDGVTYSPIAGAVSTTYTTPVLTATTYYKIEIKNVTGALCLSPTITIPVGMPSLASTSSGTRCDPGVVTLQAVPSPAGATVNWYTSATGGTPIFTGNSFTTPALSASTTYYASAAFGFNTATAGRIAPATATNLAASPRGIQFNAYQPFHLTSVTVFSTAADGGTGTIELHNNAGVVLAGPINVSWPGGGTAANPIPVVLTLDIDVPTGTGHRLLMTNRTGGGIAYETSHTATNWPTYSPPGGLLELTASLTSATATSTTTYYYFYNWQVITGCETPRTPVDAIINGSITIEAAPVDRSLCSDGQDVVFAVTASGAIDSYQWRKDGFNIPGATSPVLTITNATTADVGDYDVIVSGPCSVVTSPAATLEISAPTVITADPVAQSACPGGSATFTASATGNGSLGYQWRKDGIPIVGAYGSTFTLSNVTAADAGNYDVIVTGGCNQDTSIAVPLAVGAVTTVTTQPTPQVVCAGNSVSLSVVADGTGSLTYQWRKGGTNIAGATSATYTISSVAVSDAGNYDVVITGGCGTVTSAIAGLAVNATTFITTQPTAQFSCIGSNVTFSVTASGSGSITYQWRKGGADIAGATSPTYTINNVSAADIADYDVVITGSCGTVTSNVAPLMISAPGTWIGVQNSDWNNGANWCGTVPTSTTDVTIPSYAPNMPVLTNIGAVRNITIENGASVTVSTGGVLNLHGNITGAGTFTPTLGTVAFRSATAQSVPAFTATNVTMNGAGGFALAGTTTITGTLTLTSGHITLGDHDLVLGSGSNGSVGSHIITNGNGTVIAKGVTAQSAWTIPVGISAASYTPAIITANGSHVTDDLSVKVVEHVLTSGTTGSQFNDYVVDRTWLISETTPGGSNVDVTLQWNEGDELPQFGRNECYVMHYTGGAWVTGTESIADGANPYRQTISGITSLAPMAVQTDRLPDVSTGIYPNPVRDVLNVIVRTNAPEKLTIRVFDMTGKLIKTQIESVGYGSTLVPVNVGGLAAGTYVLKVSIPRDREFLVRRFVKVN